MLEQPAATLPVTSSSEPARLALEQARGARLALGFLLLGLLLRLALSLGTEPYFDEAYYRAWAARPAASYFDHPPMVAWLIALWGLRSSALVCGLATVGVAAVTAHRVWGTVQAALWAGACASLTPALLFLGVLATPDAPLLLSWALALWAWHARSTLGAGLSMGAALLSKYSGVLLGPVLLLDVLFGARPPQTSRRRRWGRLLGAGGLALLCFTPVVYWNAQHDWLSFRFQLQHGLGGNEGLPGLGRFALGQLGMFGPILLLVAVPAIRNAWARPELRLFIFATVVPLVFFGLSALRGRTEANWPAMAWIGLSVLMAGSPPGRLRWALGVNALLLALVTSHLLLPMLPLKRDVWRERTQGWKVLGQLPAAERVYAPDYQLAAQIQLHRSVEVEVVGGRPSQYDLWMTGGPSPARVLWVSKGPPPPEALASRYPHVQGPQVLEGIHQGKTLHRFHVWRLGVTPSDG